ncbi:MAG: methyl-accepting chemotaxis protein [Alphaproteobacteria bacterium]
MIKYSVGKLSFANRIMILFILLIILILTAVTLSTVKMIKENTYKETEKSLELNLNLGWNFIHEKGNELLVKDNMLYIGEYIINDNNEIVDKIQNLNGGIATIFLKDLRVSTNVIKLDGTRAIGTKLTAGPVFDTVLKKGMLYKGEANILNQRYLTIYDPIKDKNGDVIGILFVGVKNDNIDNIIKSYVKKILEVIFATLFLSIIITYYLVKKETLVLKTLQQAVRSIINGDTNINIKIVERNDEIGELAKAVDLLRISKIKSDQEAQIKITEDKVEAERKKELTKAITAFSINSQNIVGSFSEASSKMLDNSSTLNDIASNTSEKINLLSKSSHEVLNSVKAVVTSNEDLNSSISNVKNLITDSVEVANKASTQTNNAKITVQNLIESSNKIGTILEVISDIAKQINLLALNAAIEAARAGESGRGFAVVASQVKTLASQATNSASEIANIISLVQSKTNETYISMNGINDTIKLINDISLKINASFKEQESAIELIYNNSQASEKASNNSYESTLLLKEDAVNVGEAAKELTATSVALNEKSTQLVKEIDNFINVIKDKETDE